MVFSLFLTKKCNLNCSYCYEEDKITTFSYNQILIELKKIFYSSSNFDDIFIELIGGEPLLEFDKIKKIIKEINLFKKYSKKNVKCFISTNGTLINQKMCNFFRKNCIEVFVSLDGTFESNFLRFGCDKKVFDSILKNISLLLNNEVKTNVHIVLHKKNIKFLLDDYIFFENLGLSNIDFGIIENADFEFFEMFTKEIPKLFNYIYNNKKKCLTKSFSLPFIYKKIDNLAFFEKIDKNNVNDFNSLCNLFAYEYFKLLEET